MNATSYTLTKSAEFNGRLRKNREITAVVLDNSGAAIDAICPGEGNHKTAANWAEWRAASIREDYPGAVRMVVYCDNTEICVISFSECAPGSVAANLETAQTAAAKIRAIRPRSAWAAGVASFALSMLEEYENAITDGYNQPLTEAALLNGAQDWKQYAYGAAGVGLVYDADIARALCSPSELKRTDNGRKQPNSRENWLDVEARALFQAWRLISANL